MIVNEDVIRRIVSGRHRLRGLTLPAPKGPLGETLKCPMKEGGVYRLESGSPVHLKRRQAELMRPQGRAEAVLLFIDLVEGRLPSWKWPAVTVTAGSPALLTEGGTSVWLVPFTMGDQSGLNDRPLFLSSIGDYTFDQHRQAVPGDPEVMFPSEDELYRARQRARERTSRPVIQSVRAVLEHTDSLKGSMQTMKQRNRLALIQKELGKLEAEVQPEEAA